MICLSPTKRAVKFAEHLYKNVLEDVPNRHVVFTVPKRLRGYFRYDRKLNTVLFQAAWRSVAAVLGTKDALLQECSPFRPRAKRLTSTLIYMALLLTEYSIPTANFNASH